MLQLLTTPLSSAVHSALLRALTPLASHSVSVSELKLLFSLLAKQSSERGVPWDPAWDPAWDLGVGSGGGI